MALHFKTCRKSVVVREHNVSNVPCKDCTTWTINLKLTSTVTCYFYITSSQCRLSLSLNKLNLYFCRVLLATAGLQGDQVQDGGDIPNCGQRDRDWSEDWQGRPQPRHVYCPLWASDGGRTGHRYPLHWLCCAVVWRNGIDRIDKVKLHQAQLTLGLLATFGGYVMPLKPTQRGYPSVGKCTEYWQWFRPLLGNKWQVLYSSGPCTRIAGILVYSMLA